MALIGSIAIQISADVARLQKGLKAGADAVSKFGVTAATKLGGVFAPLANAVKATGSALAYVARPLENLYGYTADWGKALWSVVGAPALARARTFGGFLGDWGRALKSVHGDRLEAIGGVLGSIGSGALKAGKAVLGMAGGFARIVAGGAVRGLSAIGSAVSSIAGSARQALNQLGMFAAVAGGLAAYGVFNLVKAATALGEQSDRARIVFGDFAKDVIGEAERMGEAFGVSKADFVASASALGSIFKAAGYTQGAASQLSTHFVKLATDLSSFAHIPVSEALEKIQSGLAGQVRPLREVGVFMSEDAIKAYAAAHGIGALNAELTEGQKIQARAGFITEQLKDAQGNLALTAGSVANQTRSLQGRIENLAATIGTALLPVVGSALGELQSGVAALALAWQDWTAGAVSSQVGVVGAVGETAQSIGWLQKAVGFVADAWQVMGLGFLKAQQLITQGIGIIAGGLGKVESALNRIGAMAGKGDVAGNFFNTWAQDLDRLSNTQLADFNKQLARPPASEGVDAYFARARDNIKALQGEAAKAPLDVASIAPTPTAASKASETKFSSAIAAGSKEDVNLTLRSRYGSGVGNKPAEATARNTAKTNDLLTQLVAAAGRKAGEAIGTIAGLAGSF